MSLRANVDPSSKRRTTRYCDCCDVDVDVDVDTDSAISSASSKRNTVYRARTSTIEPSLSRRCCAMLSAVVVSNNVVNSCTRRRDAALVLVMIVFNIFYFHYSSLFFLCSVTFAKLRRLHELPSRPIRECAPIDRVRRSSYRSVRS